MKIARLGKTTLKDLKNTLGHITSWNKRNCRGYFFNLNRYGEISRGMFSAFFDESEFGNWDYFKDFVDNKIYKLF